jgi:hypothetical protein
MNIQAKKLELIEEFIKIDDEELISSLELMIKTEKKRLIDKVKQPMSLDEFYKMIDQAKQDSENGRVIPHQDLKEKIKSWK